MKYNENRKYQQVNSISLLLIRWQMSYVFFFSHEYIRNLQLLSITDIVGEKRNIIKTKCKNRCLNEITLEIEYLKRS